LNQNIITKIINALKNLFKTKDSSQKLPKTNDVKINETVPNTQKKKRKKKTTKNITPQIDKVPSMDGWKEKIVQEPQSDKEYFNTLNLNDKILRVLQDDLKFEFCTPIQAKSLPPALKGNDVCGKAQTGTGKTAAFLITILESFLKEKDTQRKDNQPFALIIAPTRELAIQIDKDAASLSKYINIRHLAIYGGINYKKQQDTIGKGIDLITATPGRLIDYIRQQVLDLSKIKVMVLDEADRMLDMGFIPDVRRIMNRLPNDRQTLLFSATLSPKIIQIASNWVTNPITVEATPENIVAKEIQETIYAVTKKEKLPILLWIIKHENWKRILIFCNRRCDTESLYRHLTRYNIQCAVLSGDVPQKKRMKILEQFRSGDLRIIVATDVAGRGIHIDDISHVINYDMPYEAEDYVHRIGRTGRAGQLGKAISFACESGSFFIPAIEEYIQRELVISHPELEMLKLDPPIHQKPEHKYNKKYKKQNKHKYHKHSKR